MTYNITTSRVNGLFSATDIAFTSISEQSNAATISIDSKDTKDPIFVLINTPNASDVPLWVEFEAAGGAKQKITLGNGVINLVPVTSHGYIDANGNLSFKLLCEGSILDMLSIKVGAISYTPVINH